MSQFLTKTQKFLVKVFFTKKRVCIKKFYKRLRNKPVSFLAFCAPHRHFARESLNRLDTVYTSYRDVELGTSDSYSYYRVGNKTRSHHLRK